MGGVSKWKKNTIESLKLKPCGLPQKVSVGGYNIRNLKTDVLLSRVSMVFQDVYLFNDTIYQNIAYGSKTATRDKIIEAAKTAQCHDFITSLPHGYDTMVGEGGATLSGGEKQRISIARAILKDAPIILLDEATWKTKASTRGSGKAEFRRRNGVLEQAEVIREGLSIFSKP
jgi:ATP-binding cassette subfamily B protein